MSWFAAWVPTLLLAVSILGVHLSGNDKAPVFVLMAVILGLLYSIWLVVSSRKNTRDPQLGLKRLITFLPILYMALAIVLARSGLVDSIILLGFR